MAYSRRFPFPLSRFPILLSVSFALSCGGTASLKPVAAPDPDVACPGGRLAWNLQINDQRAQRRDSESLLSLLRDSLSRSLPGCNWAAGPDAPAIVIEIHRFTADQHEYMWDGAVEHQWWNGSRNCPRGGFMKRARMSAIVLTGILLAAGLRAAGADHVYDLAAILSGTFKGATPGNDLRLDLRPAPADLQHQHD